MIFCRLAQVNMGSRDFSMQFHFQFHFPSLDSQNLAQLTYLSSPYFHTKHSIFFPHIFADNLIDIIDRSCYLVAYSLRCFDILVSIKDCISYHNSYYLNCSYRMGFIHFMRYTNWDLEFQNCSDLNLLKNFFAIFVTFAIFACFH